MAFNGMFPAPEATPAPFGLLSAATVIEHTASDEHWVGGYTQEKDLCDLRLTGWDLCSSAESGVYVDRAGESRYSEITPFVISVAEGCTTTMGTDLDTRTARLLRSLDLASGKAVEQEAWAGVVTAAAGTGNPYLASGGTVLLGSDVAPVTPAVGMAALLDFAASCGVGEQPVLHMTPGTASVLGSHHISDRDGALQTVSGARVAVGQGYNGAAADGSTTWMYVTGPVVVHLGPGQMVSERLSDYANIAKNDIPLRADRPAAVSWDGCCHGAVRVDLTK